MNNIKSKFLSYLKPYQFWIVLSIVFGLVSILLNIALIYGIQNFTDNIVKNMNLNYFQESLFLIIVIAIGQVIFSYFEKILSSKYVNYSIYDLKNDVVGHIFKSYVYEKEDQDVENLISKINYNFSILSELVSLIPNIISQIIFFIMAFIYAFSINWKFILLAMVTITIFLFLISKLSNPMEKHSEKNKENKINFIFENLINGIYFLKVFSLQELNLKKFEKNVIKPPEKDIEPFLTPILRMLSLVPFLLCFIYGGYLVTKDEMTVGGFIAAISLMKCLLISLQEMFMFVTVYQQEKSVISYASKILDIDIEKPV